MQDSLIHIKLHLPFLRAQLVPRQRLQALVLLAAMIMSLIRQLTAETRINPPG